MGTAQRGGKPPSETQDGLVVNTRAPRATRTAMEQLSTLTGRGADGDGNVRSYQRARRYYRNQAGDRCP